MKRGISEEIRQTRPFRSASERVVVNLMRTARSVEDPWRAWLKREADLSISQYNVLRILRGAHPGVVRTTLVAERMINTEPDVTRLIDRLVRRGLVRREADPADRRVVLVGITAAGLELAASLDRPVMEFTAAVTAGLSAAELDALDGLLDTLRTGIRPFG